MLDLTQLKLQLQDLKKSFDIAITQGESFEDVKKIYTDIKKIELLISEQERFLVKETKNM